MSYQKKYFYNFYDLDNVLNTVELWQNTGSTLTPELVIGSEKPFSVEMPALSSKFQSVRGTGCDCAILCTNNMEFLSGLYTPDRQNIMIKHFRNGALSWVGYLNSEMQSEPYNEISNYEVTFSGNDGFSLMEKMYYSTGSGYIVGTTFNGVNIIDGALYTGVTSQWQILQNIFNKIALPFNLLKICLSTTFSGQTITAGSTIFHQTYLDNANFSNEDGTPETLRKVLDGILAPYGAIITQIDGNLVITDVHNLASNSAFTYSNFYLSGNTGYTIYSYAGTEYNSGNTKTLQSIGYTGEGAQIEISGGKNKQIVGYSPYILKEVLPTCLSNITEFNCTIPTYWTSSDITNNSSHLQHSGKTLTNHYALNIYTGNTTVTAEYGYDYSLQSGGWQMDSNGGPNVYLRWMNDGTKSKLCDIKTQPNLTITALQSNALANPNYVCNAGAGIKLTGKIWFNDNSSNIYQVIGLRIDITVGNYKNSTKNTPLNFGFQPNNTGYTYYVNAYASDLSNTNEKFTSIVDWNGDEGIVFPVDINLSGGANVAIYSDFFMIKKIGWIDKTTGSYYGTSASSDWNPSSVTEIRIKDLVVEIVDISTYKTMTTNDIEYAGYLNTTFADEATKVDLICGTAATPIDRGKLLYSGTTLTGVSYTPILSWSRAASPYTNIESLLINSLSSNFKQGYYSLNSVDLNNRFNAFNIIQDNTYLSGKNFMVMYYKKDYIDSTINCNLSEISPDINTIVAIVNQS